MNIYILTLFPESFSSSFSYSIVKRAQEKGQVHINFINIRDFATDKYGTVDDHPYGGGVGMIMKVDVIDRALNSVLTKIPKDKTTRILLMDPKGTTYSQSIARNLSSVDNLIIICGHYEGIDARVTELVDESISIGNFIVTGGELPAALIVDSVVRLLPGVLRQPIATQDETFTDENLEYPQYTRPETYKGNAVPAVLLSGNHKDIEDWKKQMTKKLRTK